MRICSKLNTSFLPYEEKISLYLKSQNCCYFTAVKFNVCMLICFGHKHKILGHCWTTNASSTILNSPKKKLLNSYHLYVDRYRIYNHPPLSGLVCQTKFPLHFKSWCSDFPAELRKCSRPILSITPSRIKVRGYKHGASHSEKTASDKT